MVDIRGISGGGFPLDESKRNENPYAKFIAQIDAIISTINQAGGDSDAANSMLTSLITQLKSFTPQTDATKGAISLLNQGLYYLQNGNPFGAIRYYLEPAVQKLS